MYFVDIIVTRDFIFLQVMIDGDQVQPSMPTHISVWGYMYPLVFPFGGTCSFLRVHIF